MKTAILMLAAAFACGGQANGADFVRAPPAAQPVLVQAPPWRSHLTLFHLRLSFLRRTKARDNPLSGARLYALRMARDPQPRPRIDTRVNELGDGAVASFGYHPGVVANTLGPHELDGAAEPQLGHSESSAGVSLKIPL
ncbi:MAG TPA: hypothetical protein VG227_09875 [Caulobacteraceae bacterium]|nr:hypothetical protein [Caulobacteraceae bacterium]